MKISLKAFLIITMILILGLALKSYALSTQSRLIKRAKALTSKENYVKGQLIVKFKNPESAPPAFFDRRGNSIDNFTRLTNLNNIHLVELPIDLTVKEGAELFSENPDVEYVSPNYIYHKDSVPNDLNPLSWGLNNTGQAVNGTTGTAGADINILTGWDVTTGSSNVTVAIVDSGIDLDHPDLEGNIWVNPDEIIDGIDNDGNGYIDDINGWDFVNNDNDPNDDDVDGGHGTMVSGIISAIGNNGIGVSGVTWNSKLMPLKVLDSQGFGLLSEIIQGIDYAIQKKAKIINASFSGEVNLFEDLEKSVIKDAGNAGILFVTASGNGGIDLLGDNNDLSPVYPASYDLSNIITVTASNQNDSIAGFANFGIISVDIAAPGTNVYSTAIGGTYMISSGTSFAAPYVSGLAALLIAKEPTLNFLEIKARILSNVKAISSMSSKIFSGGRIDAANSLNAVNIDSTPPLNITDLSNGVVLGPEISLMGIALSDNTALISWTATGDDNNTGNALRYDLRASTSEILGTTNWETLDFVDGMPTPSAPGTKETVTVGGLEGSTTYYFSLKIADESGNNSELSNILSVTTPGTVNEESKGICFINTATGN